MHSPWDAEVEQTKQKTTFDMIFNFWKVIASRNIPGTSSNCREIRPWQVYTWMQYQDRDHGKKQSAHTQVNLQSLSVNTILFLMRCQSPDHSWEQEYKVNRVVLTFVSRDFEDSNMLRIFTFSARYSYHLFLVWVCQMHALFFRLLSDSYCIFMEQMPFLPAGFPTDLAAQAHLIFTGF